MKIAILSRKPELYSTSRLVEAAKRRDHKVHVIDHLGCYMNITSHNPEIHYKGEQIEAPDAIIPRIGASRTFYGTANSNQVLMEAMGLQLPGGSFVNPGTPLREALTRAASLQLARITAQGPDPRPLMDVVDERSFVNAVVALLASGGSTNHSIHLIAMARSAGR